MVTERYGAEAGERLVEYTVEQLTGLSRDADILARIADDEFAILLPNTTSSGAVNLMKRLEARLEKARVRFGQQSIKLSVTLGIGGTGDSGVYDPKSLLERAGQMVREERKRREKSEKVVFFEHQDPILPNSNDR